MRPRGAAKPDALVEILEIEPLLFLQNRG